MKRLVLAFFLIPSFASSLIAEAPFSDLSFDNARRKAASEKKVVMVDFYTTWCGPCRMLDNSTWKDERVRKWLAERTVPLKIDAERQSDLAAKYQVRGYPSIVFIRPNGTPINTLLGFRPADQFLADANTLLAAASNITGHADTPSDTRRTDPKIRSENAKALAQKDKKKEALDEYLWCFDHGLEYGISYEGVRLSFLLSDIASLGQSYPPAINALQQRRDTARSKLFPANPNSSDVWSRTEAAREFAALNDALHEPSQTIDAFNELKKEGPPAQPIRTAMLHRIDKLLLKEKRYTDLFESDKSSVSAVDAAITRYKKAVFARSGEIGQEHEEFEKEMKLQLLDDVGDYYEAAVGAEKFKLGIRLAGTLIKFSPGLDTYKSLLARAYRTNKAQCVTDLLQRAEKDLKPDDLKLLHRPILDEPPSGG